MARPSTALLRVWMKVSSFACASDACHAPICTASVSLRTGRMNLCEGEAAEEGV